MFVLIGGGMGAEKIARVVGVASTVLFNEEDPADPINRRISIIVMNKAAEEAARGEIAADDAPDATVTGSSTELPPGLPTEVRIDPPAPPE